MAKQKVYLSKSNASDPDELMLVRKHLAKYDVEVVEFRGGNYSHDPMLECDVLLVLPPKNGLTPFGTVDIGRGQYEQIRMWDLSKDTYPVMITVLSENISLVQNVTSYGLHSSKDQNWQDYWGSADLENSYWEMREAFDMKSELTSTDSKMTYYDFETARYPQFIKDEDSVVPMLACITLIK